MNAVNSHMIAPCGMNCAACKAHLRKHKPCVGCNSDSLFKPNHCKTCYIKQCEDLKDSGSQYCYACPKFPCQRFKQLNKRYVTKYHVDLANNLLQIKAMGIESFFASDILKWTCPQCNHIISLHTGICTNCGFKITGDNREHLDQRQLNH